MDKNKEIQGYYYEDFRVGEKFLSPGRTISEYDVMAFAGISGDYNQLHTDKQFAKTTPFRERVAHGLLGLSVVSGLAARLGLAEGTALALRGIKWKFLAPIRFDDTIRAEFIVKRKRKLADSQGGYIDFDVQVYNQQAEKVQRGSWSLIVKTRDES